MGLDRDQALALSELEKRKAVVHYSLYPHAFMIQVPDMSFPCKPANQELLAIGERALSESRWSQRDGSVTQGKTVPSSRQAGSEDELVGDARSVMVDICSEPGRTIEERCGVMRMDRAREFRAREALVARGIIEHAGLSIGGRVKLFQPSAKGVEWAARQGIKVKTYKSGSVHEYILHQVEKAVGSLGPQWRMQRNSDIARAQGLQPDLLILAPEGRRIVLEVCCNNMEYEAGNLRTESCLSWVDALIAVTPDRTTLRVPPPISSTSAPSVMPKAVSNSPPYLILPASWIGMVPRERPCRNRDRSPRRGRG
jgi:hypothetical protein